MSTRCQIQVFDKILVGKVLSVEATKEGEPVIYRHFDGYPGTVDGKERGVLTDLVPYLKRFLKARGFNPSYMTARIVGNETLQYGKSLKGCGEFFTGFGVDKAGDVRGDIAYFYTISHAPRRGAGAVVSVWEPVCDGTFNPVSFKLLEKHLVTP
jgi:hypothetical protein